MNKLVFLVPLVIFWITIFAIAARVLHRVGQRVWRGQ